MKCFPEHLQQNKLDNSLLDVVPLLLTGEAIIVAPVSGSSKLSNTTFPETTVPGNSDTVIKNSKNSRCLILLLDNEYHKEQTSLWCSSSSSIDLIASYASVAPVFRDIEAVLDVS